MTNFYARRFGQLLLCLILLLTGLLSANAQTRTITGTVITGDDHQAFPGATVRVEGSAQGTTTDARGHYSLPGVPENAILDFSAVGFQTLQKPVKGRKTVDAVMDESSKGLNELVVVGYGTQKKRDVTGAISTITSEDITKRQPVNMIDALQNQAPGVFVVNDAGAPGATGSIRIRGYSTFSSAGNSPLFVIDGVISDNADNINPADIKSIEVLKDAASAAIYGSRAANGVIIITTKQGVPGQPRVEARFLNTYGILAHKLRQANADEVRLFRQLQSPNNAGAGTSADSLNPSFNADNDYQKELTQLADRKEVDLSVSGGAKNLNYYSSLRYVDDKGLIVNSWQKTVQARINIDYQASSKFKFGNRLQFAYNNGNVINEGNTINQTFQRPTNYRVYLPDGSLTGYLHGRRNPLTVALDEMNQTESYSGSAFTYMDYDIVKGLKFTTNFNVDLSLPHNVYFSPKILSSNNPLQNNGSESFSYTFGWQYQAYLNYNKTIGKYNNITVLAGFSAEHSKNNSFNIAGTDYGSEDIFTSNNAQTIVLNKTGTNASANSLASVFGRVSYSYKDKYILNGTIRRDGSSRFGKAHPWGDFPSVGAAWHLSDESFMSWARSFLTDAKLRVSYGVNGNERIGDYDAIYTYTVGNAFYNGISGIVPNTTFGNKDLSWESTHQLDFGLDLSLLNNRIYFVTDYYIKTTQNLLYDRNLPVETGYNTARINLGSIQDKGLEFAVNTFPVRTKNFEWSLNFNISFENGIIKQLYNHQSFVSGGKWLIQEGGKLGDFYGWKELGVYAYDQSNAYDDNWNQLTPVFNAQGTFTGYTQNGKTYTGTVHQLYGNGVLLRGGDVEFANYNKDSVIDDADRVILGNAQPTFYAGLINTFTYKNFSLTFAFNTSWGGKIYNNAAYTLDNYATSNIIPQPYVIYHAWSKQGDVTTVPEVSRRGKTGNFRVDDNFLEDGSFIRLANARLAYNLSPSITSKIKMKGLSVYLFGTNLLTWTKYSWYDPEFSSSNVLNLGQDNGRYPRRREFGFGIDANF